MTCCVNYYMHIKHRHHSSISHHMHIIIHYYYCEWVMCTLVQYTGRQSQNIEVFHHIHTTYCTCNDGYGWLKKKIKKGSPTHIIIHYYYCEWVMCTLVQYTGRQSQNIEVFHHIHTTYCTCNDGYGWLKKKIKKGSPTHIIIHYYYCEWVMCTLVQYTGRQSQNIEVFHHIHTTYCTCNDGYGWLKKKIKKGSPTRGRTNPWLAL